MELVKNVISENIRAEKVEGKFDFVVSRAVTNMTDFVKIINNKISTKNNNDFKKYGLEKINLTPTFIFFKNNKQIGRIKGYTNPEMFWWQVDEIIDD